MENELIVWDKKTKKFRECMSLCYWNSMDVMYSERKNTKVGDIKFIWLKAKDIIEDKDYHLRREGHKVQLFNYIGLKDIEDKKIYADSSIVEFNVIDETKKQIGYFSFDQTILSYVIELLPKPRGGTIAYKYSGWTIQNIKIIDTIQENKLGLIK